MTAQLVDAKPSVEGAVIKQLRPPRGMSWKYRLRLSGVPLLARLGHALGMNWLRLGERLGRETLIAQARSFRNGRLDSSRAKSLDIVFLTMLGGHTHNVSVDAVLALALSRRGHRIKFVLCDQALPICEVKKAGREKEWQHACAKCYGFGRAFLTSVGFEVVSASELAQGATLGAPDRWHEIVDASLLKHYLVGIAPRTEESEVRRQMLRESASISTAVGMALIRMRPDRVIMSHGLYTTWGPQRELLNEAEIPVVTYSKTKKRGAQKFNWTVSADWWDVSAEWARVKDTELTPAQEQRIDRYLESRRTHSNDTVVYNFGAEETSEDLRARLGLDQQKPTFVLFTNVLWDAAAIQREIVFENPIEWVMQTIEWFASHSEKQLVIKIHPAEVVIGTNQPFASLIASRFPKLPANVRVIEPREIINSWSVIHIADAGLVHTSTVGLELPLEGVPCVLVSRTYFRGAGFTTDVSTRDEYFNFLETFDTSQVDRVHLQTLAKRFAFLLFERAQIPFPFLHEISHTDVRALRFASAEDLLQDENMALIVEAIEGERQFLTPA